MILSPLNIAPAFDWTFSGDPECEEWRRSKSNIKLSNRAIRNFLLESKQRKIQKTSYLDKQYMPKNLRNMKFFRSFFQKIPKQGYTLFIGLHGFADVGRGRSIKSVNEDFWKNMCDLYSFGEDVLFLAPRAPGESAKSWMNSKFVRYLDRLIGDLILLDYINPNKVYLLGKDRSVRAVYYIANLIPYRFASIGGIDAFTEDYPIHNLINLPFLLHSSWNNKKDPSYLAWGNRIDNLKKKYKGFFICWRSDYDKSMNTSEIILWMLQHVRNPYPRILRWVQPYQSLLNSNFYWLAVPKGTAKGGDVVLAEIKQNVFLCSFMTPKVLILRLNEILYSPSSDFLINLSFTKKPNHKDYYNIELENYTFDLFHDPYLDFAGEVTIKNPEFD